MLPKVSIIIPLFNSQKYIERAICSCIDQTYKEIEIIVIDDGSTDNSRKVIEKFIIDGKIRYFYQTNGERSSARNYGLRVATGEYINFLDSDDFLYRSKIEEDVLFLEKNKDFFATYSGVKYIDINDESCISVQGFNYKGTMITDQLALGNFIPIQSVLFKRNSVRFDEELNVLEDWYFFLNVFFNKKVFYIDKVLSAVRVGDQLSNRYLLKMTYGEIFLFLRIMKDVRFKHIRNKIFFKVLKACVRFFVLKIKVLILY